MTGAEAQFAQDFRISGFTPPSLLIYFALPGMRPAIVSFGGLLDIFQLYWRPVKAWYLYKTSARRLLVANICLTMVEE
jgi:hypothetical protein